MSVEVIGEDPKAFKEITCSACAARLRYTESDVKNRIERDYGGGSDTVFYIMCPRCEHMQTVRRM